MIAVIQHLWNVAWDLWETRNDEEHKRQVQNKSDEYNQQIQEEHRRGYNDLTEDADTFRSTDINKLLLSDRDGC
jgi:hypothetical protein